MPKEISQGFQGFKPEDFTVECDCPSCDNTVNLLANHVRGHFSVERVMPFFDPEAVGGATEGRLRGRPEADGVFCDAQCFADTVLAHHQKHALKMFAHEEPEFPYGENKKEYQAASEKHNAEVKNEILKQVRETVAPKK